MLPNAVALPIALHSPMIRTRHSLFTLAIATFLLVAGHARAQFDVSLELAQKTYLLHEPVKAFVNVTNLSSRDIVVGGPSGTEWITFSLTGNGNQPLSPYYEGDFGIRTTIIKAGQKLRQKVILNRRYPLSKRGNYSIQASVYYPPLERYIATRTIRFNIDDGRVFWQRPVAGPDGSGGFRAYQLITYNDSETTKIYLRIRDEASGSVLLTYSLGRAILHRQPQATIDNNNNLHVIFMGSPNAYSHTIINSSGKVLERKAYTDKGGNPPRLMQANDRSVGVRGGNYVDPDRPDPLTDPSNPFRIHSLSERPAGWTGGGVDPLNFEE